MRRKTVRKKGTDDTSREEYSSRDAATLLGGRQIRIVPEAGGARTVSLSSAAARELSGTYITAGGKTFSRPGRSSWLAILLGLDIVRGQEPTSEAGPQKEVVGELTREIICSRQRRDGRWGGRMTCPASETLEIIWAAEESSLPVQQTLERSAFRRTAKLSNVTLVGVLLKCGATPRLPPARNNEFSMGMDICASINKFEVRCRSH